MGTESGNGMGGRVVATSETASDPGLINILRCQFPSAHVIHGDAVGAFRSDDFDVVISNLPFFPPKDIIHVLSEKKFRVAVMSVRADDDLASSTHLQLEDVAVLDEQDFFPRQPFKSRLIRIQPQHAGEIVKS